jgi:hypothetical protein
VPPPPSPADLLAQEGRLVEAEFDRIAAVPEPERIRSADALVPDLGNGVRSRVAWPLHLGDRPLAAGRAAYRAWLAAATAAAAAGTAAPVPDPRQPWVRLFATAPDRLVAADRRRAQHLALLQAGIALAAGRPLPDPGPGPAPRITVADAGEWLRRGIPPQWPQHIDRLPDGTALAYVRDDEGVTRMIRSSRGWVLGIGDGAAAVELSIGLEPWRAIGATAPNAPAPPAGF